MTVREFIETFSHNNEIYVMNKDNYRMTFFFNENDKKGETKLMDWYLPMSDIRDNDVICIKQVWDTDGGRCLFNAITIKVDTDRKSFYALRDRAIVKSPLWFVNKVFEENENAGVSRF